MREITRKCMSLPVITRTLHALSMNATCRLHAFYGRVGGAIPLTGTVTGYAVRRENKFKMAV